jgi:alpha-D-xyloside xylohydrolase
MRIFWLIICGCLAAGTVLPQDFTKTDNGVRAVVNNINVEIQFYRTGIVRVIKSPQGHSYTKESLSVTAKPAATKIDLRSDGNNAGKDGNDLHGDGHTVTLRTSDLQVALNLGTGTVSFSDLAGRSLMTEKDHGAQFLPLQGVDKPSYEVRQAFLLDQHELIFGLGQQQNGRLNQRGESIDLRQENMKICIPFFQSSKGYGLFWDNYSPTKFRDGLQETSFTSEVGDCSDYYFLFGGAGDASGRDGAVSGISGRSVGSDRGEGVMAEMRELTGQTPMMPLWTYGFLQSRERYKTQFELLGIVKEYRKLGVPLDGIVQDWQYWGKDSNWNAMAFDPANYPRPKKMVDSVHKLHAHIFIVAWPGFGPATKQYALFRKNNMLIHFDTWPPDSGTKPYDPYNPGARDIYWSFLKRGVFDLGTDAWWLDSSEPDHINVKESDDDQPTYLGSYRRVVNAFPLEHIRGVYEHQRKTTESKRVVILTRSAFAGQQRFASCNWSGDVLSDWRVFRKQIAAGVNLSLSGIPYWNTDIGGFFAGRYVMGGGAKNPDFQELYIRWLQFAAFTPMMRSHGTEIPREIFQFGQRGDKAFDVQEKFINLRYSLLPYIYSTAWDVTAHAGSIMRALYLDFPEDVHADTIDNEYLFGRSLLVCPVTEKLVASRQVYLPSGTLWYDFWSGDTLRGGQTLDRLTPIDILPLYVRAGAIIPWGPKVQYAEERPWDNLEIRVYPGADGQFTLYEDERDSYNYEKGLKSEIDLHWNDQARTLTIDERKGSYPGMLQVRKFTMVAGNIRKIVEYTGAGLTITL